MEEEKKEEKAFIFSEELKTHPVEYKEGNWDLKDILGGEQ